MSVTRSSMFGALVVVQYSVIRSVARFEVRNMQVFLKSMVRPSPSLSVPLSNT
jgi:hypothetical protein